MNNTEIAFDQLEDSKAVGYEIAAVQCLNCDTILADDQSEYCTNCEQLIYDGSL